EPELSGSRPSLAHSRKDGVANEARRLALPMRKTIGKESNGFLVRRTPMRPVEDRTRPRAMVPPWLLASALLPRRIAKTAAPRDWTAPRSSMIDGPRLRASWKYRGMKGAATLHASAAPAR